MIRTRPPFLLAAAVALFAALLSLPPAAQMKAPPPAERDFVPPAERIPPRPRPPVLRIVSPAEQPVTLQSLRVDAQIAGSLVRTEIEMVFFNPNGRILEGELQFPLVAGQSIAGFAMDIDGVLRDAVPVGKARGQAVFEDVTRQRIDPALIEATQGENFKLRVYPITPRGTKTVVIRTVELLAMSGERRVYRLALEYASRLQSFALRVNVHGAKSEPRGRAGALGALAFRRAGETWQAQVERRDFAARGLLELELPAANGPVVQTEERDGRSYFYAEIPVREDLAPRKPPRSVALVWDSSGSGAARDHAREFALLDLYFRWMKEGSVRLTRLRDTAEPTETFVIAGGDWQALRRALAATAYDGATALGAYDSAGEADEVLLFSDGISNFGSGSFAARGRRTDTRIYTIHAAVKADRSALRGIAGASGGRAIDLVRETPQEAHRALTHDAARVLDIEAEGAEGLVTESIYPAQGRIAVAGELREGRARLRLQYGLPGRRAQRIDLPIAAAGTQGRLAAARWAALRVAELDTDHELHRAQIARLGRAFGLVTRETSLIVLDRIEDYVRYDIAPPAPLLARYEELRQRSAQRLETDRHRHLERIVRLFAEKQAWWKRDFPKDPTPFQANKTGRGVLESPDTRTQDRMNRERGREGSPPAAAPAPALALQSPAALESVAAGRAMADTAQGNLGESAANPDGARIQLRPWTPDAAYARRMREASAANAYRIYLDEKPGYAASTAFYLDAADLLFEKGLDALAVRVLGNLAEMDLENRHILRVLGYRLVQAKRPALAVPVFRKVLALAPEEPQSYRDLGLALAADGQYQKAIDALYEVVVHPWHGRFPEVELIALAELNAIVATAGVPLDTSRIDPRLLKNLALDLRAVLTWDADNTDIDLWITDPSGEKAFYGHRLTRQGGRVSQDFTGGYGPEEFSLKKAMPGRYRIEAQFYGHRQQIVAGATTLQLNLQTAFGRREQKDAFVTLRLTGRGEVVYVGEVVIE